MNVLVLGSGGREDAICTKLCESKNLDKLYAMPGNGGIGKKASLIPGSVMDKDAVYKACLDHDIQYVVVTPDDPLADGMVDFLSQRGIKAFGPDRKAARIESSKAFAKELMRKYSIPTAGYAVFSDYDKALEYVLSHGFPTVIKADGLALGKGVTIAQSPAEAEKALKDAMLTHRFGHAGETVVIEEFLSGPEISVLAFTDGRTILPMVSSMDHKRAYDNDEGPNTGGMGTIAPNPYYDEKTAKECMEKIFIPTIRAMEKEGSPFKGCLYFGLMKTEEGVKVIEYNSRFGDPETQVVLPLLSSNLLEIMMATTDCKLNEVDIKWREKASCAITITSSGYPGEYEKGKKITIAPDFNATLFVAGAKEEEGALYTTGGRVLNVVSTAVTLKEAVQDAYRNAGKVHFEKSFYRHDIGKRALEALNG